MLRASYIPYNLVFRHPAGTSRGVLHTKESWFICIKNQNRDQIVGIGECSLIKGLSPDPRENFELELHSLCENINDYESWTKQRGNLFPAIRFGLETALDDLNNGGLRIFATNEFTAGRKGIPINGLIWMGEPAFMKQQIREKLNSGFSCIKIKVGAVDFDQELGLLRLIRSEFGPETIEIRVDANGAFTPGEAPEKLKRLSAFSLHSVEQPIKQGQPEAMALLCETSPIPIALDEELIGLGDPVARRKLLNIIKPHYIVLKPSLLGGLYSIAAWAMLADTLDIKWWVTSALESNIGLNAIAQWTYLKAPAMAQGLGTGLLYVNNFASPLVIEKGHLFHQPERAWDLNSLKYA